MKKESFNPEGPYLLLCEGKDDAAFFRHLRAMRKLPSFQIFPEECDTAGGNGNFAPLLKKLNSSAELDGTIWHRLRGIVIVVDACDDPVGALANVASQTESAGFARPDSAGRWWGSPATRPAIAIVVVPESGLGGLETVALQAARPKFPAQSACVNQLVACAQLDGWPAEKRGKAELAALVAVSHQARPAIRFYGMFDTKPPIIDVCHPAFTPLTETLRHLLENPPTP